MKKIIYWTTSALALLLASTTQAPLATALATASDTVSTSSTCPVTGATSLLKTSQSTSMPVVAEVPASDEITKLDNSFQASYASAKQTIRDNLGPVIIVASDVMLLKNGKRENANFIPEEYTVTKTVDHIPLDIFVILTNVTHQRLSEHTIATLNALDDYIIKTSPEVDKSKLSVASIDRQHKIINLSRQFIKSTLSGGTVTHSDLQKFTRSMAKLTLDNADEGIASALEKFDNIITGWHSSMTEQEWNQTYAIVVSGHMPRIQNSSMQYLQKLFHQKQEGDRVIYFEGDFDETKAIDLLVTHILDRRIAIDFYKDPWRMHRDLLADGAKKYLKEHPPGNRVEKPLSN